jgi:exopolyphosphatase/guanosine-5'-triphosphate,3'-diphosphate pyrophosphatase
VTPAVPSATPPATSTVRVAAVDIGSNSVRLLVLDGDGERLVRRIETTRLAAGIDRSGRFDDAAVERTVAAVVSFHAEWTRLGAGRVRITATSAARDATDRARLLDRIEAATAVRPEVIPGDEEAELAFEGATAGVDVVHPVAVVDVGGGSTELVLGDAEGRIAAATSMRIGCVRLTERSLHHDPVIPDERAAAEAEVERVLDDALAVLRPGERAPRPTTLVAVAGTATTLAALALGLDRYDEGRIHGATLTPTTLDGLRDELLAMDAAARDALGPMQPGRADVIHGGAIVLAATARRLGVARVVVSERDGLDAVAARLRAGA